MILLLTACGAPTPVCPTSTAPDPEREAAIGALVGPGPLCFTDSPDSVVLEGAVVVSRSLAVPDAAARVAHLRSHLGRGPGSEDPNCREAWFRLEQLGWDKELRTRRELGLPVSLHFEEAWRAGDPEPLNTFIRTSGLLDGPCSTMAP